MCVLCLPLHLPLLLPLQDRGARFVWDPVENPFGSCMPEIRTHTQGDVHCSSILDVVQGEGVDRIGYANVRVCAVQGREGGGGD